MIGTKVIIEIVNVNAEQEYDGHWTGSAEFLNLKGVITAHTESTLTVKTEEDEEECVYTFTKEIQPEFDAEGKETGKTMIVYSADIADGAVLCNENLELFHG